MSSSFLQFTHNGMSHSCFGGICVYHSFIPQSRQTKYIPKPPNHSHGIVKHKSHPSFQHNKHNKHNKHNQHNQHNQRNQFTMKLENTPLDPINTETEAPAPKRRRKSMGFLSATLNDSKAAKDMISKDMARRRTGYGANTSAVLLWTNYRSNTSIGLTESRMYSVAPIGDKTTSGKFALTDENGLRSVSIPHKPTGQEKKSWASKNGGDSKEAQVPKMDAMELPVGAVITVSCFGPDNNPGIVPQPGDILDLVGVSFGVIRHKSSQGKNAHKHCDLPEGFPKISMTATQVSIHRGSDHKMLNNILRLPGASALANWKPAPLPLPYPEPEAPDFLPPLYGLPRSHYENHVVGSSPLVFPVHNGRVNYHLSKNLPGPLCGASKENVLFGFFQETPQELLYDNQNTGQMNIVIGTGKNMCTLLLLEYDPTQESGAFERGVVQIGVGQDATSMLGITSQIAWEECGPSLLRGFQGNLVARSTPDSANLQLNNEDEIDTWGAEAWASLQVDWLDTLNYAAVRVSRAFAKNRLPKMKFQGGNTPNPLAESFLADAEGTPVVNITELKGANWEDDFPEVGTEGNEDAVDWEYYILPTRGFMIGDMNTERDMLIREIDIKGLNDAGDLEASEAKIRNIMETVPMSRWGVKGTQIFAVNRKLFA